jgi:UDP-N-acetylmuramoyl-tripeptide--D-alanyl-D-alanine ligase
MTIWTPTSLRAITGGSWLRRPASTGDEPLVESLSTDTRGIKPGEAFLALRGDRFDAHDFLDSAATAGAALLIIDRADAIPESLLKATTGPAILRVTDSRRALGQLAAAHRKTLEGTKVIAVVGSNGKTTTTKLIDSILKTRLRGTASPKSFNNDVGVPLTLLAAKRTDQYVVCEVGSNHPGETAILGRIVQPDIVVVTSIGRDHMEFFGSLAVVAREHASIFSDLRPNGLVIVPAEETALADYLKPVPNVITVGRDTNSDLRVTSMAHTPSGLRFAVNDRWNIELPLVGEHNALNALAAIAVAKRLGIDEPSITKALAAAAPIDMRLNRRTIRGVDLLIDCYNSNPDSLAVALRTFAAIHSDPARRVIILGDMLEMGSHSDAVHLEAMQLVAHVCPARLIALVGPAFTKIAHLFQRAIPQSKIIAVESLDAHAAAQIGAELRPADAALLKGSRGIRLEQVIAALENAPSSASPSPLVPSA